MIRYIFSAAIDLTKTDMDKIMQGVEINYSEGSEAAMTLADMLRDEGMERGLKEGMEKGGIEALSQMATRLLIKKFYIIPEDVKDGLSKLDKISLEVLIEEIFELQTIDEVRKYIH